MLKLTASSGDSSHAYSVALSVCRVAVELDAIAEEIRNLEAKTVDAEWLFGPGEGHALGASVALGEALAAKRAEAARARRHEDDLEVAA